MDEARLKEIQDRERATSPGPWETVKEIANVVRVPSDIDPCEIQAHGPPEWDYEPDLHFIAHARQDIPDLLAEVRRLKALLEGRCGK